MKMTLHVAFTIQYSINNIWTIILEAKIYRNTRGLLKILLTVHVGRVKTGNSFPSVR